MLTLYHWDLPQALENEGGWLNRATADRFAEYATVVHAVLGDRVDYWTTLDEPMCSAFLGYGSGVHAPGVSDPAAALIAAHHLLLAHGLGMSVLRAAARRGQSFSLVLNLSPARADEEDEEHHEAVRKFDGLHNRLFLDPALGRGYPPDVLADVAYLGALEPAIHDGDLDTITTPPDWLGVNCHAPTRVAPHEDPSLPAGNGMPGLRGVRVLPPREPLTEFGWEQAPDSLTDLLLWLHDHCAGLPLMVMENGAPFVDAVDEHAEVHDEERVRYLARQVRAVHAAIQRGADVRGYLGWSLLDNFDWTLGYSRRFGLVHVDFDTQRRTIKDSARFLAEIMADNAVPSFPGCGT
jgi:beta-glucosidase